MAHHSGRCGVWGGCGTRSDVLLVILSGIKSIVNKTAFNCPIHSPPQSCLPFELTTWQAPSPLISGSAFSMGRLNWGSGGTRDDIGGSCSGVRWCGWGRVARNWLQCLSWFKSPGPVAPHFRGHFAFNLSVVGVIPLLSDLGRNECMVNPKVYKFYCR